MEITPKEINLENLLAGTETRYMVPEYQRDYSWTPAQIEELWNDIQASFRTESEYFMGTLVLNKEGHNENQYDIVDGQQRLATFTILFSTIRTVAKEFEGNDQVLPRVNRNSETYGLAVRISAIAEDRIVYRSYPDQYFLSLNKKDKEIFRRHIQENTEMLLTDDQFRTIRSDNRIIKAKKTLHKKIIDSYFDDSTGLSRIDALLRHLIKRLKFISIEVASDYDAYLLFESLNSKGLELSIADLLKNKMLMVCQGEEEKKQQVLDNWERMSSNLLKSRYQNLVDFLRFYWLAFEDQNITQKELYKAIKNKIEIDGYDIVNFSRDLAEYSGSFVEITDQELTWPSTSYSSGSVEQHLAELNTLRYSICVPCLLYAACRAPAILKPLAKMSVAFLFRLITIGDYSVGNASEVFNSVLKALKDSKNEADIKTIFLNTGERISDSAFTESFSTFRTTNGNIARYILTKLHVYECGTEQMPNEYHLEHILPQSPVKWLDDGFDKEGHKIEDVICSIGNMTLLDSRINISISNSTFSDKIDKYQKRQQNSDIGTTFPMTYKLHDDYYGGNTNWTVSRINERSSSFAGLASEIWKI